MVVGEGKKARNFGLPTLWAPTLRVPTLLGPTLGGPKGCLFFHVFSLFCLCLAIVGLAKVGQIRMAKVGLAKVGLSRHTHSRFLKRCPSEVLPSLTTLARSFAASPRMSMPPLIVVFLRAAEGSRQSAHLLLKSLLHL